MSRLKAEYKRLKKLVKRNPILYVRLADIELQMGKVKEARNRLLNGLESDAENSTAYLLLAQAQGRLKDAEGSLKSYEEVLRLDPLNLRARKAYVELLHLLGRTDLEYAAHTRLYELSPSDTEIESKQKALVHWTMKQLFGDDFEWQDEWHPGDITEIGGLSTVVSKELELMPQRTALPKQFAPDVDDSLVTQMIARLPSTDDDEQVEEFKLPAQKAAAEESSNGTGEGEADSAVATEATTESEAENYDPDSNLIQHTDPVEPKPPAPEAETGAESVETDAETVAPSADDEDAAEPPAGETKPAAPVAEAEPATPEATDKPATADAKEQDADTQNEDEEDQEVGVEDILAKLTSEGSGEDAEESEEHIPTPLEKAVQFGGQPLDHVVDFKQVLNELKQDELVLVENPDLEATVPEIQAPAKPETADEPEADETTDSGDEESNAEAPVEAEPEAVQQPNDEPAAETEAEVPKPEPEKQPSGALNQSDLDALLAQFQSGQAKPAASTSDSADAEDTTSEPETEAAAEEPEAAVEEDKPAEPSGPMNQGDLDALMASFKAGKSTPAPSTEEPAEEPAESVVDETEPEPAEAEEPAAPAGPLDQNSLDELMAAFKKGSKTPAKNAEPEPPAESGEPVAEEPAAEEPEAEVTAQGEDDAPVDTPGESAPEAAKTPAEPAAKKAQERPPMPEASIPKKPASQEDLDDLISQFASKRRGKPGSQKPVEIGKYASRPKDDTESRQDDKKAGEPAADSAPEENITEGLKQKEEKVPELTEDELARRASYAMTPSRVEDEIESLEDNPDAEDETRDLSEADASHEDSFEPYGLSKSGSEPADQPPPDDKAESAPATEPAPESRTEPEASADPHPQPEPQTKAPRAAEPPAETSSEPEPQTKPEPSAAAESTSTPAPEKRSTPAPAPPPPAAQPKPKAESEPAAMAPRPKRTPPPQPKRDETAPEEYRGPVSKTLIRLQIGQGKYDHARAMLNRLRQQSPADPDLEKLAEQIEAAIS